MKESASFTENPTEKSTKSRPFEKLCKDFFSIPLIREHHVSSLYYIHYKTCESSFADVTFTVVFNPSKNKKIGFVLRTINPRDNDLTVQDVFVLFLNNLQEANDF